MADMAAFSLEDTHSLEGPRERVSVAPLAIGYVSLSFFARNFLISAFVGSPEQCWLCPAWRAGRAWGALHEMAGKKSLTTGQARFPWAF